MATAPELQRLDDAHYAQQAANAGALAVAMNAAFAQVRADSLASTGTAWLTQAIALIVGARRRSALLALAYSQSARRLRLPGVPDLPTLPPIPDPPLEQLRESLIHVGLRQTVFDLAMLPDRPVTAQRLILDATSVGTPEALESLQEDIRRLERETVQIDAMMQQIMDRAQKRVAAASVRHVQNGGRDATRDFVKVDRRALGFVRVTRPDCCFFCAMLASRGPVFAADSFVESDKDFADDPLGRWASDVKVHDSCGCQLRPIYTRSDSELPDLGREADDLWRNGLPDEEADEHPPPVKRSGAAARNEFRRIWDLRSASVR